MGYKVDLRCDGNGYEKGVKWQPFRDISILRVMCVKLVWSKSSQIAVH